ncbi:hypothetical protein M406DRAFT_321601 [Cryphonectria parasitica EP155]|uniref:Uncharacterized protein n=1 Tax=Cryphonectria parasitica (strain ATCC 38755 / EP155) TaxID=660469 RepID=A0A9P4Y6B2_CRYP1|nr:uncharacterized protein M406DRAFT_321601 [Cryphonectria parasitica EP155]KAF3767518.1 hypothetical protein M406DRAFT_321601 [Cryphonectria parasitica EP155]
MTTGRLREVVSAGQEGQEGQEGRRVQVDGAVVAPEVLEGRKDPVVGAVVALVAQEDLGVLEDRVVRRRDINRLLWWYGRSKQIS